MSGALSMRRVTILVVLIALVAGAASFDDPSTARRPVTLPEQRDVPQIGATPLAAPSPVALANAVPAASAQSSASTTWYCAGGAAEKGGARDTTLVLSNRSAKASQVRLTVTTAEGKVASKAVSVPDASSLAVPLRDIAQSKWAGVVVEASGGGVVVNQRIGASSPVTTAPCATDASTSWFFANGNTDRGAGERLVLFNPFKDLVTADVAFLTDDGFRQPQRFHGVPVSPGSLLVLDVAEVENRKVDMASMVSTRAGRLIVWRTQTFDGSGPSLDAGFAPKGVSVALGATTAAKRFVLPTAVTGEGVGARVTVANPGTEDATVALAVLPDDPATNGTPPAIHLEVPAGAVRVLGAKDLVSVPAGVPFSVTGTVTKGGPVIGELWLDGAEPAKGHGSFAVSATPSAATTWVISRGLRESTIDQLGVVGVDGVAALRFAVLDDGKITKLSGAALPKSIRKGARVSVDLAAVLKDHPGATMIVTGTRPVVVSRLQAGTDAQGLVSFFGLPVAPQGLHTGS